MSLPAPKFWCLDVQTHFTTAVNPLKRVVLRLNPIADLMSISHEKSIIISYEFLAKSENKIISLIKYKNRRARLLRPSDGMNETIHCLAFVSRVTQQ
jgi:hypothetical protein